MKREIICCPFSLLFQKTPVLSVDRYAIYLTIREILQKGLKSSKYHIDLNSIYDNVPMRNLSLNLR